MLTFSYINCFESPTHIRRAKLLDEKAFWCECSRCLGPDYARGIRCKQACKHAGDVSVTSISCNGYLLNTNQSSEWTCSTCKQTLRGDSINEWIIEIENQLTAKLNKLKQLSLESVTLSTLDEFSEEVLTYVSHTHYLMIEFWAFYNTIGASISHYISQQLRERSALQASSLADMSREVLEKTILSGTRLLSCIECVAARCLGDCVETMTSQRRVAEELKQQQQVVLPLQKLARHDPVNEAAHYAVWLFNDLRKYDIKLAKAFANRYVSVLYSSYGPDDPDVKAMKILINLKI